MSRHGLLKFRMANSQRFWAVCQATPLDKCLWDLPNLDACSFDSWQKTFCKKKWSAFARILHLPFAWSMLFNLCFLLLGPPKCWTSILHYPAVETFSDLQYCWVRPSFSINPAAVHSLPHFSNIQVVATPDVANCFSNSCTTWCNGSTPPGGLAWPRDITSDQRVPRGRGRGCRFPMQAAASRKRRGWMDGISEDWTLKHLGYPCTPISSTKLDYL